MRERSCCKRPSTCSIPILFTFLLACTAPPFSAICSVPENATADQRELAACACSKSTLSELWAPGRRPMVDLLLVVDNSGNMATHQAYLAPILDDLIAAVDALDYHIGVVTTDVGSWTAAGVPWTMSTGACDSFSGDDGKLQAISCLDRLGTSAAAAQVCGSVCPDHRFLPNDGTRYLSNPNHKSNVPSALEIDSHTGQTVDRGPAYALKCMAMVGDAGCPLASPLEAMQRALDGHAMENTGFLRDDALLWILILTDKDDCSVKLARRGENDPHTTDCSTPDGNAAASCFDPRYRCLARNLVCDQPMNTAGQKTGCHERSDSYLNSVDSYVQFLSARKNPSRVELLGIVPMPAIDMGGQLIVEQNPKVAGSAGLLVGQGANATCAATQMRYGQAELRLNTFLRTWASQGLQGKSFDLCSMDFSEAWTAFPLIGCNDGPICLRTDPARLADGTPRCLVGDVPAENPESSPAAFFPACSDTCCGAMAQGFYGCATFDQATVTACLPEPADCYCVLRSAKDHECQDNPQLRVWRQGYGQPPPGTVTQISCAAQPNGC